MTGFFKKKNKDSQEHRMLYFPSESEPHIESREYKIFKKKERIPYSWFENLARFAGSIIKVSPPDENTRKELKNSISFTGLRITPEDVMALVVLTAMSSVILSIFLIAAGVIPVLGFLFITAAGVGLSYYFLKYPSNLLKAYRIQASSQVVLAILYMVVSMRVSPNLEQALRFAASNISGPLAWDMRRLLWDIEMGKYYSASHALVDYIAKWKPENEEFAEALRLIRDSQTQPMSRQGAVLDEALDTILEGTKVRMKHYAQELSLPVSIIHMMGIVLPVMGSIMAPMAAVFLSDIARPEYFAIGYDIILPIFLIWFINTILKKRPSTFSQVDTSKHPDLPPNGKFIMRLGDKKVILPVLPFAVMVALIFLTPPMYFFSANPEILFSAKGTHDVLSLIMSCMITMGIAFSLSVYFMLSNYQRVQIQGDIEKTESEFEVALFQLGNRISAGVPAEVALEKSIDDVKDLTISGLFTIALRNIKNLGMTFKDALFHPKWGAVNYYPSRLIENIMYMVIDIGKKGVKYAAEGMLTIAKYLRSIKDTQEYIRELLQDSVSSMTFQAYMLTPMVTGLIVSMAQIIIKVLTVLSLRLQAMTMGTEGMSINMTQGLFGIGVGNVSTAVSPEMFQIIIGIYLIEVIIILAMFITKITKGENKVYQWYTAGKMLIIAVSMYFLVAVGASAMFGDLIRQAIESIAE